MIDMALLRLLRRWYFRDGMPIREITRCTELSRNTVRKYLASDELEPRYRRPKPPSKLDDYEQTHTSWLRREKNVLATSALRLSTFIKIQCKCWVIIGCNLTTRLKNQKSS